MADAVRSRGPYRSETWNRSHALSPKDGRVRLTCQDPRPLQWSGNAPITASLQVTALTPTASLLNRYGAMAERVVAKPAVRRLERHGRSAAVGHVRVHGLGQLPAEEVREPDLASIHRW